MRRVKFPFDLDVTELLTPELKKKVLPIGEKLKDFDKDRRERTKVRRKMRKTTEKAAAVGEAAAPAQAADTDDPPEAMLVDTPAGEVAGELPDEATKREEELAILTSLVDSDLEKDKGSNVSGLYELVGIVSHKGASADGGSSSLPFLLSLPPHPSVPPFLPIPPSCLLSSTHCPSPPLLHLYFIH